MSHLFIVGFRSGKFEELEPCEKKILYALHPGLKLSSNLV